MNPRENWNDYLLFLMVAFIFGWHVGESISRVFL